VDGGNDERKTDDGEKPAGRTGLGQGSSEKSGGTEVAREGEEGKVTVEKNGKPEPEPREESQQSKDFEKTFIPPKK
jgi:hypothetical protein